MRDQHTKQIAVFGVVAAALVAAAGTAKVAAQSTAGAPGPTASASPSVTPSAAPTTAAAGQEAVYIAQLASLGAISNGANATARFVKQGTNNVAAVVEGSGLAANDTHIIDVHAGTQCPDSSADTNGDGIVDAVESEAVTGPAVVALTVTPGYLSAPSHATANDQYPYASPQGNLLYGNSGPLAAFLQALSSSNTAPVPSRAPSTVPVIFPSAAPSASPGVSPTPSEAPSETPSGLPSSMPGIAAQDALANLAGHVVVIRGVDASTALPSTVQSSNAGVTAAEDLPVACGIIQRQAD